MVGELIRKATIWDTQDITKMWSEMQDEIAIPYRTADDREMERFYFGVIARLQRSDWHILIAEDGNKPAGFIMGNILRYEYGNSDIIGNCDHLFVKPEYRGSGIGSQLITELNNWAKISGATIAEFTTVYDEKLIRKWQHRGYIPSQVIYTKEV